MMGVLKYQLGDSFSDLNKKNLNRPGSYNTFYTYIVYGHKVQYILNDASIINERSVLRQKYNLNKCPR